MQRNAHRRPLDHPNTAARSGAAVDWEGFGVRIKACAGQCNQNVDHGLVATRPAGFAEVGEVGEWPLVKREVAANVVSD